MLVPPVAQGGTGGRQVGDSVGARGQQSSVPSAPATLWPLAPAQHNQVASQQSQATPPLATTPAPAHNQGVSRYGLYSLFPGGGGASYVAATPATPCTTSARAYHATTHKVSESVFSAAVGVGVGGYTWGAPTPPPGSPYSPVPVTQLELLAKNLASLAPHHGTGQTTSHQAHHHQALSLQGAVGVNVAAAAAAAGASLHHSQHTQHTLNLAGLHHLHHGESTMTTTSATSFTSKFIDDRTLSLGGLHQNTFSPQLSLVTAGTPTLTINSFSSPTHNQGNVVPTTGMLLQQDYHNPPQAITSTGCPTTVNVSTIPSGSTTSVSTMLVQAGQTGHSSGGYVQQTTSCSSTKKLDNFGTVQTTMTGQTVKLEKTRQPCICRSNNGKTKLVHSDIGCSRTLPVVSSWNGQQEVMTSCTSIPNNLATGTTTTGIANLVKREPMSTVPCQVAEVSTSLHATSTAVKIEPMQPKSENGIVVSTAGAGGIPVGIAVARQRLQHQETTSSSMRNVSLSHHTSHHASYHHFQPDSLGSTMAVGGTTLVHCGPSGDDRPAHLAIPSGALAPSLNAALGSTLNSGLGNIGSAASSGAASWPPTIWQYPTAAMPAMEPVGFPQMGVGLQSGLQGGLQLVRDPTTGHLLLIHAAAEQMQQAVVWPNYPSHNGANVGPPPLLLPPPPQPPSLQLLSDIGGARLVLTENKRKQQSAMPIVKIEADCSSSPTTIIASAESSKTLQTVTSVAGTLMPDAPLLTTLHYYPHAPALVQISQAEPTHCTSQQRNTFLAKATSPVSCLTPPPEVTTMHAIETPQTTPIGVQDASNQTDGLETDEEPLPSETYVKQEQYLSPCHQQVMTVNPTNFDFVSSSHERPRMQFASISTQNSMVDQSTGIETACNVINKFEKSATTIVNPVDCTRYATTATTSSLTTITKCTEVNSVDRTIESVVSCRSSNDEKISEDEDSLNVDGESTSDERISRIGSRVIEITEENCDSFHENLEFFGRRRDPVEQIRKPFFTEEMLNEQRALEEKRNEESMQEQDEVTSQIEEEEVSVETPVFLHKEISSEERIQEVTKPAEKILLTSVEVQENNCHDFPKLNRSEMLINQRLAEEEPSQIGFKSFDMPSIDCEEDKEVQRVVVKQERNEDNIAEPEDFSARHDTCHHSDKTRQERKQSVERFHPGIENVVEKLKKNAAAALQDHQTTLGLEGQKIKIAELQQPRNVAECPPRRLENGLKNLILRSCENPINMNNFSKSETTNEYATKDSSVKSLTPTDNNNDSNSNNNNLKMTEDIANHRELKMEKITPVGTPAFHDEEDDTSSRDLCAMIPEDDTTGENVYEGINADENSHENNFEENEEINEITDNSVGKLRIASKPRQNVDLSGLELLSNSIEQFEHLKPGNIQNGVEENSDSSPTKVKPNCQQPQAESNNNNVDSPLGLLCALAEQRFMEEVADNVPKKLKENLENSEEISQAGRLLLNLGKVTGSELEKKRAEKRKYVGEDLISNDSKRICEENGKIDSPKRSSPEQFFDRIGKARRFVAKSRQHSMCSEESRINVDSSEEKYVTPDKSANDNFATADVEADFTDSDDDNPEEASVCPLRITIPPSKLAGIHEEDIQIEAENERDWPNMDAMELDMRVRMADIQKQYKEKQKELSKLPAKKNEKRSPGRPRKKSHSSSDYGSLDLDGSPPKSPIEEVPDDEISPALPAMSNLAMPRCNVNLVKLGEPKSHIKLLHSIPSIPIPVPPVASPITVLPTSKMLPDEEDKNLSVMDYETSSPAPTITSSTSASKKRKVGRPRKLMCTSGSARHLTETIVAKKPKSKGSLVGYLVASKNRHLQNKFVGKSGYTPLPFKSGLTGTKNSKAHKIGKSKIKPVKQTPLHNKNVISSIIAEKAKLSQEVKYDKQGSKVRPKLKAEAKLKDWEDEESGQWNYTIENIPPEVPAVQEEVVEEPLVEPVKEVVEKEPERDRHDKSKKKKRKSTSASPTRRKSGEHDKKESKKRKSSLDCRECRECAKAAKAEKIENIVNKCKLTSPHLEIEQLRVLTAMGGLFYAGRLSAVQAPDVYAITLDGERGNRPHIHSREEILRDAIVEVCPTSTKELTPGTRLCAYWSQQYRCLYPGTSVEPSEPDSELDEKFVSVEFDDGDSGRIALDDIRLLQPDYPVVEYDPNPLLTLGKRRRQTSTSIDEKRSSSAGCAADTQSSMMVVNASSQVATSAINNQSIVGNSSSDGKSTDLPNSEDADAKMMEEYRARKRLKKRRRDKLKRLQDAQEGKKKHRRHKCCEEHRKHKHRKHRKHKHRHSHHSSYSEGSHVSGGESCSGQKSEEEAASKDSSSRNDDFLKEKATEEAQIVLEEEERLDEPMMNSILPEEKAEKPKKSEKKAKARERQESVESRSKMAAFLPARQLWGWAGKGYRRPGAKGRAKKQFFKAIQRGSETIQIGDSAVFLSTGRPDRPYIGRIESMWETSSSNMIVKVKWFYHPEETVGCPGNLKYPGALFESPHMDENDVQTISHKCEVLPLPEYTEKLGKEPHRYLTIYDNNDIYYLAGYYDPTTYLLTMQPGVV